MGKWQIWHKDGSRVTDADGTAVALGALTYSGEWMGACNVSADYMGCAPVGFAIGDWIEYRGERFVLEYAPGVKKQARRGTSGEAFVYEGMRFDSLQCELVRCDFTDLVLGDNGLHWTGLSQFSFYMEALDDLLDRVQACLDELYGQGVWSLYSRDRARSTGRGCDGAKWDSVYGGASEKTSVDGTSLSFSDETCWDALSKVNSEFDVNFTVRNREVFVGTAGVDAGHMFRYGRDRGLGSLEKAADSEQYVVTRLKAYGSSKNLPVHYYADLGVRLKMAVVKVVSKERWVEFDTDLTYLDTCFTEPRMIGGTQMGWVVRATFDGKTEITGFVEKSPLSDACRFYSELRNDTSDAGDEPSEERLEAFMAATEEGRAVYLTRGFDYGKVPVAHRDYSKSLPGNMAVNRLMLPGFPTLSLKDYWDTLTDAEKKWANPTGKALEFSDDAHRPWIQSGNAAALGVRPASVMFDTKDKKNGIVEIYPTIEEMTVGGVRIDETDSGSDISDDGRYDGEESPVNFDIRLRKELDFDLNDVREDDFTISMKDGPCGGRSFEIRACRKEEDGRWCLTLGREKDDATGLWFPYKDYQINAGDHFVLTGLKLPGQYVEANALRLLRYAIAYLADNDHTKYTYTPEVDEIMMARQHDEAMADKTGATRSLHDTLKEGDLLTFDDEDLGIGGSVTIAQLTIKEEYGQVATYEVTLREEKEVGRMEKMQGQIDSIASGNGFSSGVALGLTAAQARGIVESEGGRHFISKTRDDVAEGLVTFRKGLVSEDELRTESAVVGDTLEMGVGGRYVIDGTGKARLGEVELDGVRSPGATEADRVLVGGTGFELYRDARGRTHLWVDDVLVRGRLTAASTEVRKVSYSGGTLVMSAAGSTVAEVEEETVGGVAVGWRLWCVADDGTTRTANWWRAGDMAWCRTMDPAGGLRGWWRLVTASGQAERRGRLMSWLVVSGVEELPGTAAVTADGTTLAAAVKAWDGGDTDDGGVKLEGRTFRGCDPGQADVPAVGDVLVQTGSQVRWEGRGGVILLRTTADDGAPGQVPSLALYAGMGKAREDASGALTPWQWAELSLLLSPARSYVSSARLLFFPGGGGTGDAYDVSERLGSVEGSVTRIEAGAEGVASRVSAVEKAVDGLPLKDAAGLARYTSELEQTARRISARVTASAASRRNMLTGSALWRAGDGVTVVTANGARIVAGSWAGLNGFLCVSKSTEEARDYNGLFWRQGWCVPVTEGMTYTVAVMARPSALGTGVVRLEGFWQESAQGGGGTRGGEAFGRSVRVEEAQGFAAGEWLELSVTFVAGGELPCVEVCMYALSDAGQTCEVELAAPRMGVGSQVPEWSLSERDADYIGGNLLPGTDSLSTGGGVTVGTGVAVAADGDTAVASLDAQSETADARMLMWTAPAEMRVLHADCMLSMLVRGSGSLLLKVAGTGALRTYWQTEAGRTTGTGVALPVADGTGWRRVWALWHLEQGVPRTVSVWAQAGSVLDVKEVKAELGARVTDWRADGKDYVETQGMVRRLRATGIDIEDGTVTVTADNFFVRNNAGVRTAAVDADGRLTAGSVSCEDAESGVHALLTGGMLTFSARETAACIRFGYDAGGRPLLVFTNEAGAVVYSLGADGVNTPAGDRGMLSATATAGSVIHTGLTYMYSVTLAVTNVSGAALWVDSQKLSCSVQGVGGKWLRMSTRRMTGEQPLPATWKAGETRSVVFSQSETLDGSMEIITAQATWICYGSGGEEIATGKIKE